MVVKPPSIVDSVLVIRRKRGFQKGMTAIGATIENASGRGGKWRSRNTVRQFLQQRHLLVDHLR